MTRLKESKLNLLLNQWPNGVIRTSRWLSEHGYYKQLIKGYCDNGWVAKVGQGAYSKLSDDVNPLSGIHALQQDLNLPIHLGALTALELHGLAQNVVFDNDQAPLYLFNTSHKKTKLPQWFFNLSKNHRYIQHHLFKDELGLENKFVDGVEITVSAPERAILEVLNLVPGIISYEHANNLMENMQLLRPDLVQQILEKCLSFKVKRLFLYLADKFHLPCFMHLHLNKVDLGKGKRVIDAGGTYIPKYLISVPKLTIEERDIGYV